MAWQLNVVFTGADIDPSTDAAGGLVIPYPAGVSIAGTAGHDLTVMALACVDRVPSDGSEIEPEPPVLGDGVVLGHKAMVCGPVRVGNGVHITPGCVVTTDVEAHTVVASPAPKAIAWGR